MDRYLEIRRPVPQKHQGLSTVSKVFFGVDIFQVVIVVTFQSVMVACGNFNAFSSPENPGMGPGRRIYMCVYMGVVVYTCFLCLFAVKQQNILEIFAFLLQNFAFVTYGLIQVYHVGYKKLHIPGRNVTIQHSSILRKVALTNSLALFLLNGVFIFLSWKLYSEFGWKIYKRVRFNMSLRSTYHFYQLLSCLLKMEMLYWWMYSICNSLVLLKDTGSVMYYVNLAFIPLSMLYAGLGYIATRREIRILMSIFILWTIGGASYFMYKVYGFISDTCNGCQALNKTGKDIHDEAILHFVYLGSLNLILLLAILVVVYKVFANFGKGLEEHFKPPHKSGRLRAETDLYLRRVSHYAEESVVSVTSYDSEFDELNESMRLDYHPLASAASLINSDERGLTSSMPNLVEACTRKAKTFPFAKGRTFTETTTLRTFEEQSPLKCKLAAIDEDTDNLLENGNGLHKPGDNKITKRKETNGKLKSKCNECNGGSNPKGSNEEKDEKPATKNVIDNGKFSDGLRDAERDSGFVDCHGYKELNNYGLKAILKTRKTPITDGRWNKTVNNGRDVIEKEKYESLPRSDSDVKSKINISSAKD